MKIFLKILPAFLLLLSVAAKAQLTVHPMVHAGYAYQNQSFGEVGGRLLFLTNDDTLFRVGAAAMMGETNGKFAVMPKLQADILLNFEKNVDIFHSWYFLLGAESTNKYIAPKAGFSLFGIIDLTGGYAFNYGDATLNGKQLKGFNFNLTFNIPLVALSKK
ncbi:hypothetical protein VO54_02414 [Elizabethkingia miricola]|nr:hypothetical protein VO54_02414 [Elizabethkingia miricola]